MTPLGASSGPPMPEGDQEGGHGRHHDRHVGAPPPLEPPWGSDADLVAHPQAQIEAPRVHEQPLQDVAVTPEVDPSHAPGPHEVADLVPLLDR